jgi:hypothetical protein
MIPVQRQRAAHRVGLALQPRVVDAGAAPDPFLRLAAEQGAIDRRRDRGVADAHFAEREQIRSARQRLHAESERGRAGALVERGALRDVARRLRQREFVHLQRNLEALAELVDRRAAGLEIGDHRLGDGGRERRHALRDDAVIAGEDGHQRRLDMRLFALPSRHEFGDLLEPPERACGLGELGLPLARRRQRRRIDARHILKKGANVVEGARHRISRRCLRDLAQAAPLRKPE